MLAGNHDVIISKSCCDAMWFAEFWSFSHWVKTTGVDHIAVLADSNGSDSYDVKTGKKKVIAQEIALQRTSMHVRLHQWNQWKSRSIQNDILKMDLQGPFGSNFVVSNDINTSAFLLIMSKGSQMKILVPYDLLSSDPPMFSSNDLQHYVLKYLWQNVKICHRSKRVYLDYHFLIWLVILF